MVPVWRLVRNRHGRRMYETLSALGVTVARMIEYEARLDEDSSHDGAAAGTAGDTSLPNVATPECRTASRGESRQYEVPARVSFESAPATADRIRVLDLDFSIPVTLRDDEWVIAATVEGEAVGRALVSAGEHLHVESLGERMTFDGAFVRRVYVDSAWRNRGVARRLVAETLPVAEAEFGVDAVSALIAPDNKPSQWAFEANGFEPVRHHDYLSVFGREWRRVTEL